MVRGVPWALWLSSGLVIALLLFSTVMLMVTPTDSTSEFQPLVRQRSTTTVSDDPSDTATDEEVQQKISELFKQPPTSDQVTPPKKESCSPEFPICNNVDNYPHNKINDIVAKYKQQYAGVFGEDVVVPEGDALVTRFDTSNDRPLCYSVERLIHPQEGFTKDKINLTIVNTKEYKQGVRVELCSNPAQTCNELDGLMGQYRTECKQLYHYRTLLAVHPKTGELYKESFKLPSCCKCVIKPLTLLSDGK